MRGLKFPLTYTFLAAIFVGGAIAGYAIASNYSGKLGIKLGTDGVSVEIDGGNVSTPRIK
jgi:hypothetical protein